MVIYHFHHLHSKFGKKWHSSGFSSTDLRHELSHNQTLGGATIIRHTHTDASQVCFKLEKNRRTCLKFIYASILSCADCDFSSLTLALSVVSVGIYTAFKRRMNSVHLSPTYSDLNRMQIQQMTNEQLHKLAYFF